jgi:long-chain acyl-CoA synthetase
VKATEMKTNGHTNGHVQARVAELLANELSVHGALARKHLLITGVTGFLGKVWLGMLLDLVPEVGRVSVLVRPPRRAKGDRTAAATARFEKIAATSPALRPLRAKLGAGLGAYLDDKLEVVAGDVSQPLCGIEASELERLAQTVDLVVHFAGLTDFEPDPKDAVEVNVLGAVHVADVTARLREPRLVHTSTCYVAGQRTGEIRETRATGVAPDGRPFDARAAMATLLTRADAAEAASDRRGAALRKVRAEAGGVYARELAFPNTYTFSKALAEQLLAERTDVRVSVVRPSIVECARSYPLPGWNEGINTSGPLVWLLSGPFFELPSRPELHFDVVPVDDVAKGTMLVVAAALGDSAPDVVQMGTSHTRPFTVGRAIELTGLAVRKHHERPGASSFERLLFRYLDAVPVPAESSSFLAIPRLRRHVKSLRGWLDDVRLADALPRAVRKAAGEQVSRTQLRAHVATSGIETLLRRIDQMLALYKPFIHDHDWVFLTDRMGALSARLTPSERATFGWDVRDLDWRSYWLDVQVPGLATWCLPLMNGKTVPDDAPAEPRLRLARSTPPPPSVAATHAATVHLAGAAGASEARV